MKRIFIFCICQLTQFVAQGQTRTYALPSHKYYKTTTVDFGGSNVYVMVPDVTSEL